MIPLKRKSTDKGIFANKSYGKTITMNALGFLFYLKGHIVFSNQDSLKYPYIKIESTKDLKKIGQYPQQQPKILLMEDFERWLHSRNAQDKTNMDINSIMIDNGKNNCSTIYTSKRPMAIDIGLRDTTDDFIEVHLILPYDIDVSRLPTTTENQQQIRKAILNLWANDFEKLWVQIEIFDSNLNKKTTQYLTNLPFWGKLYDTQEIIKDIQK